MSNQRHASRFWCSKHRESLQRACPECRDVTGFDDPAWDYYVAKKSGVVLPLPLCRSHGNVAPCAAGCTIAASEPRKAGA